MKKEIYCANATQKNPHINGFIVDVTENSMIPVAESGLCLNKGDDFFGDYVEHIKIEPEKIKEARTKVIESVELKEIDRLKLKKSFIKQILSLSAEKKFNFNKRDTFMSSFCIIQSIILFIESYSYKFIGEEYERQLIVAIILFALGVININLYYKFQPIKTLRYLRLSLLSEKQRKKINNYIKENHLENLVDNCEKEIELNYYATNEEELKKMIKGV